MTINFNVFDSLRMELPNFSGKQEIHADLFFTNILGKNPKLVNLALRPYTKRKRGQYEIQPFRCMDDRGLIRERSFLFSS